jgi:hypothetical protein
VTFGSVGALVVFVGLRGVGEIPANRSFRPRVKRAICALFCGACCPVVAPPNDRGDRRFPTPKEADVRRAGESDRETLRDRAAHAGPIGEDTLVYRIELHAVSPDAELAAADAIRG